MVTYDPTNDSDKMRALVQLAASIADPLANVANSLATEADMLTRADAPHHLPAIAALIKRSARRTASIVSDLLAFTGQQPAQPRLMSVVRVLSDLTSLLERLTEPSALIIACPENVFPIQANLASFEQIMCTLVARARDAIPDKGTITIHISNLAKSVRPDLDRDHVCIEIGDTGSAIQSPEQIFEPVLRRKNYGLWLGLSTVYGAILQMHGRIMVESDPSNGAKFTILLPAYSNR